jgi:TatA/E family protein of Tat protein translocase
MFGIGVEELIVILLIILLLTGGKKIPELSRGIGQAVRELRKGFMGELDSDDKPKKKTKKGAQTSKES